MMNNPLFESGHSGRDTNKKIFNFNMLGTRFTLWKVK